MKTAVKAKPGPKLPAKPTARTAPAPDAMDIISEMEQATTLNKFFDDNPEDFTNDDYLKLVKSMRQERPHIEKDEGDE